MAKTMKEFGTWLLILHRLTKKSKLIGNQLAAGNWQLVIFIN